MKRRRTRRLLFTDYHVNLLIERPEQDWALAISSDQGSLGSNSSIFQSTREMLGKGITSLKMNMPANDWGCCKSLSHQEDGDRYFQKQWRVVIPNLSKKRLCQVRSKSDLAFDEFFTFAIITTNVLCQTTVLKNVHTSYKRAWIDYFSNQIRKYYGHLALTICRIAYLLSHYRCQISRTCFPYDWEGNW